MTAADSSWPAARVRRGGLTALWIAERRQPKGSFFERNGASHRCHGVESISHAKNRRLAPYRFHEAISADPPLLTNYQVVVIGVTDREAKAWAEEARLLRTAEGLSTNARTLAAQIGLAKAMQKYDLRKLITFHSSVAKAARFVDATRRDSLPGVIPHLTRSARPSGKLAHRHSCWSANISRRALAPVAGSLNRG